MKAIPFAGLLVGGLAFASASLAAQTTAPAKTQSAIDHRFDKLDANHDGKLSADELTAGRRAGAKANPKAFAKLDTDGDGAIERSEFEAKLTAAASRADAKGVDRVAGARRQAVRPKA